MAIQYQLGRIMAATCCLLMAAGHAHAQEDITDTTTQKITQAFYSTRVIQSQSIEMLHKGNLDVRILHRFGPVDQGIKELFGLDQASMRMGFDYGISDHLTIGVGRSTYRKEYDALLKFRALQQSRGARAVPLSVILSAGAMIRTADETALNGYKPDAGDRTSFYGQLIAGRKFNRQFSFQLIQTLLHMNYVNDGAQANTQYALGGGARYKLSKRLALTLEYNHVFTKLPQGYYDPLSAGLDIETGGHVFQLHFSNSTGMNERAFLTETTDRFFKGEIRFGFNLSRMFQLH